MKSLDIGRIKYTNLRQFLDPYIYLPSTDDVRDEKNKIVPTYLCIGIVGLPSEIKYQD